jgi:glycerophosphoryl diester phosphodiesterase
VYGVDMRTQRRIVTCSALLAAALAACGPRRDPPPTYAPPAPLVIAHRGGGALWPENTLVAFRNAVALGADVLELDVRATADGRLVVIHDATVDRTTEGRGAVAMLTLAEVQRLDAAYRFTLDDGRTFPQRGRGIGIPTLDALLTALPDARFSIEIKPPAAPVAAAVCTALRTADASGRVTVASFDSGGLERFRDLCPGVATGATPREVARFVAASALRIVPVPRLAAAVLQLPERWRGVPVLTPRVLATAHAHGLPVHAWVIDDAADMRRLLALGVDGIVTDRPDVLLAVLGRAPPAEVNAP